MWPHTTVLMAGKRQSVFSSRKLYQEVPEVTWGWCWCWWWWTIRAQNWFESNLFHLRSLQKLSCLTPPRFFSRLKIFLVLNFKFEIFRLGIQKFVEGIRVHLSNSITSTCKECLDHCRNTMPLGSIDGDSLSKKIAFTLQKLRRPPFWKWTFVPIMRVKWFLTGF